MEFITSLEKNQSVAQRELKELETIKVSEDRAKKLIEGGGFARKAWQCPRCQEIHKGHNYDREPPFCQNPNCDYTKKLISLHPTEHHEIGDVLLKEYDWATIRESMTGTKPGIVHKWDDGVYRKEGTKGEIREIVKKMNHESEQKLEKKVIDHIATKTQYFEDEFGLNGDETVVEDGLLNLTEMELKPHDPSKLPLSKIKSEYDPDSKCPKFKEMLRRILPSENDRKRFQEMVGTALIDKKYHKKSLIIVGPTDAGKSTILEVISGVFGDDNVSRKTLKALADTRWARMAIRFSKINISDEMSTGRIKRTDRIKKIVAGSKISAEDKGKEPIKINPTAEHIFATNQTPYASRSDDAFWNRFIVIEAPNTIRDEDKEKNYSEKILKEEKSGILNWIIEGYDNFMDNEKEFTHKQNWTKSRDRWLEWGDSIQRFIEKHIEHEEGEKISSNQLYQRYLRWIRYNERLEAQSQRALTDRIKQSISYSRYSSNYRFDGNKKRGFKNIKVVELEDMEKESMRDVDGKIMKYWNDHQNPNWTVSKFVDYLKEKHGEIDRERLESHVRQLKEKGKIRLIEGLGDNYD